MSPLDINQSDKGTEDRIAVKAFETPGNQFAGGQVDTVSTRQLAYKEWLFDSFFFPVESCIWDIGCTFAQQTNRNNDNEATVVVPGTSRTKQPTNAEGYHMIGISMFSPRDKPYDGASGMTPMTPKQKMVRAPDGGDMEWSGDLFIGGEEVALRQRGYYNKAARQLLYCNQVSTGSTISKSIDFSRKGKGRKSKKRAFDVPAGTKLVFWTRNMTGADDDNYEIMTSATITPRIRWFPKQNVLQNIRYEDQSSQRWGSNMVKNMLTDQGDGVNELFTTHTATQVQP